MRKTGACPWLNFIATASRARRRSPGILCTTCFVTFPIAFLIGAFATDLAFYNDFGELVVKRIRGCD